MEQIVTEIEVLEDLSATARCDEGFLRLRRLRCKNRHADGSSSQIYRVDVVDRPSLDAVAVLVYRRAAAGLEALTRQQLRPAAHFRKGRAPKGAHEQDHLFVEEIVAGVLEPGDLDEAAMRRRAAEEVREEAGFELPPSTLEPLGAPFFLAPGILSEKVYLYAADVTGLTQGPLHGDGTPLEEGACCQWRSMQSLLEACRSGELQDAKTELAVSRFLSSAR